MSAAGQQLPLELDETARMLAQIEAERLHESDRHIVFACRVWFETKGPTFTAAQRRAVSRIFEEATW